jgi:putative flippase GtrA
MSKLINLSSLSPLIKQSGNYFGAALIGLIVDFGTLIVLKEVLSIHYLLSAIFGFIAGLIVVFILSERYVFTNPKIKSKMWNFLIFGIIGLVGLGFLSFLMWFFTEYLGIYYVASKILATIFVYMWNFFARRSLYEN